MPKQDILQTIKHFLEHSSEKSLKLVFAHTEIRLLNNPSTLHSIIKQNSRLVIYKTPSKPMAKMSVKDDLVFQFWFRFAPPTTADYYINEVTDMPEPLSQGILEANATKLTIQFTVDGPEPHAGLRVQHEYSQLLSVN
ncbi:hypothetical protein [Flagellimonas algicola]|uniref:Uncharacterized protein n=1 Tax=Flagellimonas algicola TaxID=2583815 RepID=A0ABY2WQU7_9FLAO|nr:hypothetical protein [Allomuricauda algicola]TMU57374.1 hypothetical protein FGG15_07470 [Allomuricauda algicola]